MRLPEQTEILNAKARPDPVDVAGQDAALLSAVEVGLGSVLHAFRVPLTGQLLSLNQTFMLSRSTLKLQGIRAARTIGFQISLIAALLKSLAPAGKKLTPMLAIAMQGFLFSLGTIVFGANPVGMLVGATISALWAYLQPTLLMLVIFGASLVDVAKYFLDKTSEAVAVTPETLLTVLGALVCLKILVAWLMVFAAISLPESVVTRYQRKLLAIRMKRKLDPAKSSAVGESAPSKLTLVRSALKDLTNPLFLVSLGLTGLFFVFAESSWSTTVWALLRPLTIGFLFFYLLRWLPLRMAGGRWLELGPIKKVVTPFQIALQRLTAIDSDGRGSGATP